MKKILFVCHGNICRSPMAEFIMKHLSDIPIYIESAAVSDEEYGNPIYPPAKAILEKKRIPYDTHKTARQISKQDYEKFDMIIVMDKSNLRNIVNILKGDPQNKVSLLMDYTDIHKDVADPWYTGDFESAFNDILEGCKGLLSFLHLLRN